MDSSVRRQSCSQRLGRFGRSAARYCCSQWSQRANHVSHDTFTIDATFYGTDTVCALPLSSDSPMTIVRKNNDCAMMNVVLDAPSAFPTPSPDSRIPLAGFRVPQHLLLLAALYTILYRITFVPSGFPQTTDLQLTMNGIVDRRDLLMKNRKTILLPFRLSSTVDSVSPDKIYSCWFYGSYISNAGNMCFITYLY